MSKITGIIEIIDGRGTTHRAPTENDVIYFTYIFGFLEWKILQGL
jgi:hypothetical protein